MAAHRRPADTILAQTAYARGTSAPMLNLSRGGMNGPFADYPSYISNTPYRRTNMIIRVLAIPRGMLLLPEPEKWVEAIKALFEVHPLSVTGFNSALNVEVRGTPFGAAGEQQEVVTNVTRAQVRPVFNFVEKYGRPIAHITNRWVTELLMNPDSKYADIVTRAAARGQVSDLLPDYTSVTLLAFEPDPTFTKVDKAWIVADVKPKDDLSPEEGIRDIHNGAELVEWPLNTTGIAQTGPAIIAVAEKILGQMTMIGGSPLARQALTDTIDGNVLDVGRGYNEMLKEAAQSGIKY